MIGVNMDNASENPGLERLVAFERQSGFQPQLCSGLGARASWARSSPASPRRTSRSNRYQRSWQRGLSCIHCNQEIVRDA